MPIRAGASLETLVAGYLEELRLRRSAPATLERARVELARLLHHLREAGVRDVRAVDEAQLAAYARRLERWPARYGGRLSLATRASALCVVRCFFASLARRGRILRDPAAGVPLPHAAHLPQGVLSQRQARRLVAAPFPGSALGLRDRALLELLYGAGLRAGEARRADLNDYDPQRRVLLVRDGKGRKDRLVPVPGRAAAALERYLADARHALVKRGDGSLFVSRHGGRLSVSALQLLVRRHGKAIGVALHPHTLRHTCATHLLQGGASIRHVQQLLGHRQLTTTALYTRVAIRDLRAVLVRTHPRM